MVFNQHSEELNLHDDYPDGFFNMPPIEYSAPETTTEPPTWFGETQFIPDSVRDILDEEVCYQSREIPSYPDVWHDDGDTASMVSELSSRDCQPVRIALGACETSVCLLKDLPDQVIFLGFHTSPIFRYKSSFPMNTSQTLGLENGPLMEEATVNNGTTDLNPPRQRSSDAAGYRRSRRSTAITASKQAAQRSRKRTKTRDHQLYQSQEGHRLEESMSMEDVDDAECDEPSSRKFACPFYKFSRVDHMKCSHFQLTRAKDVKQHLLRKHPLYCATCFNVFTDSDECKRHVEHGDCKPGVRPQSKEFAASISHEQGVELSKRMYGSEEDLWYKVWSILFPEEIQPSSPFLATEVEEVIWTVCDLWRRNRSKALLALESEDMPEEALMSKALLDQMQTDRAVDKDCAMVRLLKELAEVSKQITDNNTAGSRQIATEDNSAESTPTATDSISHYSTYTPSSTLGSSVSELPDSVQSCTLSRFNHWIPAKQNSSSNQDLLGLGISRWDASSTITFGPGNWTAQDPHFDPSMELGIDPMDFSP